MSSITLGKYQIIREIARSNDIVYEAYDPTINRRVALKELSFQGGASDQQREERVRRFQREARAAGMLVHPSIVTIYEVGEAEGRHFIAMEYLEGETLRSRIDRGYLELEEAVPIIRLVLDALAFAHEHNVVHRDIKPDNVHLLPDDRVKITDFGIARLTFEPSITMDGQVFGTPSYMSPEQVVGKEIDTRSDLFSVGVMFYEMLTGAKPFFGDSVVTITYNIMHTDAAPPPGVPFSIEQVIRRAMEKSPGNRYQTAQGMLDDLFIAEQQLQQGISAPLKPGQNPYAVPAPDPAAYPQQGYVPPMGQYPSSQYQAQYGPPPYPGGPYAQGPYPPGPGYPIPPWLVNRPLRKPVLSPGQRAFLGRFFATILIGCALMGVIIGGYIGVQRAYQNYRQQQQDLVLSKEAANAETQAKRALELYRVRNFNQAAREYSRAAHRYEGLLPKFVSSTNRDINSQNLATCYLGLGDSLSMLGRYDDAEQSYRTVLAMESREAPILVEPSMRAETYARLGAMYFQWYRAASSARALLDQSVNAWEQAVQIDSDNIEFRRNLAIMLVNRGTVEQNHGNGANAQTDYRRAIDVAPFDANISEEARNRLQSLLPPTNGPFGR